MSNSTVLRKSVKRCLLNIFHALCACVNHDDDNCNDGTGRQTSIEDGPANIININNGDHRKTKKQGNVSSTYKKCDKKKKENFIFWCKFAVFLLAVGTCVASFTVPSLRKAMPRGIPTWQWSLLLTVLLGGPLVSKGIVQFILLFLDREISVKENLIYYVLGLVESAWVLLWFSMILVAWLMVVDEPNYLGMPPNKDKIIRKFASTFPIINITLITLTLGSFLWLLKDLVIMIAKSSFHLRRFFSRVRATLIHQYVIQTLSKSPSQRRTTPELSYQRQPSENLVLTADADKNPRGFKLYRFGRSRTLFVDVGCLLDVAEEEVSCYGMMIVIDWLRRNPYLTYNIANDNESPKKIDNVDDVDNAADSIFSSVVPDQAPSFYIQKKDLEKFFPAEKVDDVMKSLCEAAETTTIKKEDFRKLMMKAFVYRESLVRALESNKGLFRKFNRFINVILVFFICALWLIMIKIQTRKVIFVIATAIAGSAFIFGDTFKKLLENFLFLFWVHPFDMGDCCLIDSTPVIIEEINVLTTTVSTFDNEKKHYPNIILAGQSITNYTRCRHLNDFIEFPLVTDGSPTKIIDALKKQVKSYIDELPHHWHEDHYWVIELIDMSTMKMKLHVQHTIQGITPPQFKVRQIRKSDLVLKIKEILGNVQEVEVE